MQYRMKEMPLLTSCSLAMLRIEPLSTDTLWLRSNGDRENSAALHEHLKQLIDVKIKVTVSRM